MEYGRKPTVNEYYKDMIDHKVSLIDNTKQCCPFHHENTPSFSYMPSRDVWSCFGACKIKGADVIKMHQMNYKLGTKEEAEASLEHLYKYEKKVKELRLESVRILANDAKIDYETTLNKCLSKANTPERCVELDEIMTYFPQEVFDLKDLLDKWRYQDESI